MSRPRRPDGMSPAGHGQFPIANGTRAALHGTSVTHLRSEDGATAIIADHGAHLLSWIPAGGAEALYLSPTSRYGAADAIRGGVPVIFPQFGEQGAGKRHGIARTQSWGLLSVTIEAGAAVARLALQGRLDVEQGQHGWQAQSGQDGRDGTDGTDAGAAALPAATFRLVLEVRLQGESLQSGLTIDNTGSTAWSCQAALHTYLRVDSLKQAGIDGLQGCRFIDQTAGGAVSTQADADLGFAAEVDRIYAAAPSPLLLRDGRRRLHVAQQGFADTVIWNPGAAKAAALGDLPAQGYREFVCIESAAIANRLMLEPGASWHAVQHLRVVPADA